jgi:hypothetical protein
MEALKRQETIAAKEHTKVIKKEYHPFLKFKCPNQKKNVEKLENYIAEWEQGSFPKLPWNVQSFLKPTEKSEIGLDATINRFRKLFSFTGNDHL